MTPTPFGTGGRRHGDRIRSGAITRNLMHLAATAFLVTSTVEAIRLFPDVQAEVIDARRVTLSVGGTAAEIRAASKQWAAASAESQELTAQSIQILKNLNTATAGLNQTATSLTAMIEHTDDSINVQMIPNLMRTVGENNARLAAVSENTNAALLSIAGTSRAAAGAMAEATKTLADAGKVIGDPAIPRTLANTETASANVAATTSHVNAASADIQEKVHQMTRPASFAKRFAEAVLTLAAPVVSIVK